MKTAATLAAVFAAYLIAGQTERIANAMPALTPDLLMLIAAGACAVAAVLHDAKGR